MEELEKELREKEETIQQLTNDALKKGKKGKGGKDVDADVAMQIAALEEENGDLREKLNLSKGEVAELRDKIVDLNAHMSVLSKEKAEADANLRQCRKRIDELENEITSKNMREEAANQKSEEALKARSENHKVQLQLFQENEELQTLVRCCVSTLSVD